MESIHKSKDCDRRYEQRCRKDDHRDRTLSYFHSKGYAVQPFKVGPDYIDPGFHGKAAGRNSYNLMNGMTPPDRLVPTFASLSKGADISIIEGVSGAL